MLSDGVVEVGSFDTAVELPSRLGKAAGGGSSGRQYKTPRQLA